MNPIDLDKIYNRTQLISFPSLLPFLKVRRTEIIKKKAVIFTSVNGKWSLWDSGVKPILVCSRNR